MKKKYKNPNNLTIDESIELVNDLAKSLDITDEDAIHEGYLTAIKSTNRNYHIIYGKVKYSMSVYLRDYERFYELKEIKTDNYYECDEDIINKIYCNTAFHYISNEKNIEIIKLRFGFYYNKCYSYAEIAKIYNISPQRVRQICNRVLSMLYRSSMLRY